MARLNPSQAVQKTSLASGGLGRGWEPDGASSQAGRGSLGDPPLPTGGHGVWVDVPNAPPAPQTLSLQRQMMENLVIAKAREETVSFPVGLLQEPAPAASALSWVSPTHAGLWGPS